MPTLNILQKNTHIRFFGVIFAVLIAYASSSSLYLLLAFFAYSLPPLSHRFHSLTHATSASWALFRISFYFVDKLIKRFINVCM